MINNEHIFLDNQENDQFTSFGEPVEDWTKAAGYFGLKVFFANALHAPGDCILVRGTIENCRKMKGLWSGIYGDCRALDSDHYFLKIKEHNLGDYFLNYENAMMTASRAIEDWTFLKHYFQDCNGFFIRPCSCRKQFTGGSYGTTTIGREAFKETLRSNKVSRPLKVQISPSWPIDAEWRFVIIDRQVSTYSLYKKDGILDERILPDKRAEDMVVNVISQFNPLDNYTIDVAKMGVGSRFQGYKIIEYNGLSTSGLYACDRKKIIEDLLRQRGV